MAFDQPKGVIRIGKSCPVEMGGMRIGAVGDDVLAAEDAREGLEEGGLANKRQGGFVPRSALP